MQDPDISLPPAAVEPQHCEALYHPDLKGRHALEVTIDEISKVRTLFEQFADCPVRCTILLGDGYVRSVPFEQLASLENAADRPLVGMTLEAEVDDQHPSAKLELVAVPGQNVEITLHGSHDRIEQLRRALDDRLASMTPGYAWLAKRDTAGLAFVVGFGALVAAAEQAFYLGGLCILLSISLWPSRWRRLFPSISFRIGQGEKRHDRANFWRVTVLAGAIVGLASSVLVELLRAT